MALRSSLRKLIHHFGFDVTRVQPASRGVSPFADMRYFLSQERSPTIFDVGGNQGQTVDKMRDSFPDGSIHSFEPSPSVFASLSEKCAGMPQTNLWNCGLGASESTAIIHENNLSGMTSIHNLGDAGWGEVVKDTEVPIRTIDQFCEEQNVETIDILKSDTQGYELEVLKGASRMLEERRIKLMYMEFIFSDMYEGLPRFDEILALIYDSNFAIVSFYVMEYHNQVASWTDGLFIEKSFHEKIKAEIIQ